MTGPTRSSPPRPTPEQVARDHRPRVLALAARLTRNPDDAEDVAQDVLLRVLRCLGRFRGDAALTTWLHAVTARAAREYNRSRATRPLPTADRLDVAATDALPDGPERRALEREARALFDRAVAGLPPAYRAAYVMAEVQGRPHAEVGAALGVNPRTVKTRAYRARAMLREVLANYFGPPEAGHGGPPGRPGRLEGPGGAAP